eukprot:3329581-Pleurochrysis_carterae.AAC.2
MLLRHATAAVERASHDERVHGLLLQLGTAAAPNVGSLAVVQELRDAIKRFETAKKAQRRDLAAKAEKEAKDPSDDKEAKSAGARTVSATGACTVAYADSYSSMTYLLASSCERVLCQPGGVVEMPALRMTTPYLSKLLAKYGVNVQARNGSRISASTVACDPCMRA